MKSSTRENAGVRGGPGATHGHAHPTCSHPAFTIAPNRSAETLDGRECLPNAVGNRAYYAAYLAVAHVAQKGGLSFTSERNYYRHDSLPDFAAQHRILDRSGVVALRWLYGVRVKADYTDDPVEFDEANLAVEKAALLVENLLP